MFSYVLFLQQSQPNPALSYFPFLDIAANKKVLIRSEPFSCIMLSRIIQAFGMLFVVATGELQKCAALM